MHTCGDASCPRCAESLDEMISTHALAHYERRIAEFCKTAGELSPYRSILIPAALAPYRSVHQPK